jgi:formate hydrogenlyase subunit 6/NADH:ubiquinone oxidoreductase subunit I
MGIIAYLKGVFVATWSGLRHLFHPRMTLRYPEQKLDLEGPGYRYDARQGVGLPGFKGRHLLRFEKCTGCQLCAIACDGIAVAIDMQKVPKGKPHNKKDIWPAVDYGRCVPSGTPVVTSEGIIPIEQIKAGDKVLTHTGSFKTVTKVFQRKYSGRMFTFKALGNIEPLSVTEGHPILVYSGNGTRWVNPETIQHRTYLTRPIIAEVVQVPSLEYTYELYHPAGRGGYFTVQPVSLKFTPELARIIGYYLSEGNADRYRVAFDIHKNEEALSTDIVRCIKSVFDESVSSKPDKGSDGLKLVVDSVKTAAFFKQFGTMGDRKQLPAWALVVPQELQAEIIRTAYWSDGHYSNKFYSYKHAMHSNFFVIRTTSRALANQYSYILGRLGILASISINHQKKRKDCYSVTVHSPYVDRMGGLVQVPAENSPSYSHSYVKMIDGIVASPVVKVSVEEVVGKDVWNLEVEDDNSYVAANEIVHNCVFCGLCVDACPFDALDMTNDYELSAYDKMGLKYTPEMLAVPPKLEGKKYKVEFDTEKGVTRHS